VLRFLRRRYRLSATGAGAVRGFKPPYIVVANHVNFWDPFWINSFVPHPIQFVTSDNVFRTLFLGLAMRLLGSIPKTKLMSDTESIRHIIQVLSNGGVIGIFPEGARTFDGRSGENIQAVAKLLRKLRVPVLCVRIQGGYLARPRWARAVRRGRVTLEYSVLFTAGELSRSTVEEVHQKMSGRLAVDEMAWQRGAMVRFRGKRPAEYLERLLFVCPSCGAVSTLVSRNRKVMCASCAYRVAVNDYGFFEQDRGPLLFREPAEWNAWQLSVFREILEQKRARGEILLSESPAALLRGFRSRPLVILRHGAALLYPDRIVFQGREPMDAVFPLDRVKGVNVQNGEKLELYMDNVLYRLDFRSPRASSYQWAKAVELLQSPQLSAGGKAASL
jgi:1-acyl-sn-glycerol-3-phosphate acyltransferase